MTPGSTTYLFFIAAVFLLYWTAAQHRVARLIVILAANYYFCARFGLFYIALLPACSTLDFLLGLGLMRWQDARIRRALMWTSVAANLTLLFLSRHVGWAFSLGLSFY